MALSDILNLASTASMFIPGAQVATPFLGAAAAGVGMVESQNKKNNPKKGSPQKIKTGDLSRVMNESSKVDWGGHFIHEPVERMPKYIPRQEVNKDDPMGGYNPIEVGGDFPVDLKATDDLKTTNATGIAKTFADVNNLNKVSAGLSAVGAVGSLINEANAKPPRFAPVSKANRVNLDSDTSAFENASEANTDKLYRSTLSSLINRGLSPVMANAVAGSMKNNASNETLAKAEQFRTQTENQEAGMNAEVSTRNAAAMNQHNQYKESMQAQYNQIAGQNISSSLATLAQIPATYGDSLMGSEMFKQYLLNR